MKLVVLIKQVPDTTEVKIDRATNTLIREGVPSIINPFDTYAIEEALRVREAVGEGSVTVMSMGPPQVESALREALALGADDAVLLSDRAFAGSDTWATSYTLAAGIRKLPAFDLVLCGKQAIDGDTAQVGPGVAQFLGLPQVTNARKITLGADGSVTVQRMVDDGYDVVKTPLPAVVTVVKEINEPRLPSLKGKMKARKAEITTWGSADLTVDSKELGLDGSPTRVIRIFAPEPRGGGRILSGDPDEAADALVDELLPVLKGGA
jgi:electron transfer flavoprotein beta subunit